MGEIKRESPKKVQEDEASYSKGKRVVSNPRKPLKIEEGKKKADKAGKTVASLMMKGYQLGDFLIVDTGEDRYVGFFLGISRGLIPRIMLASKWVNFNAMKKTEVFDNISCVDCTRVKKVKAAPK